MQCVTVGGREWPTQSSELNETCGATRSKATRKLLDARSINVPIAKRFGSIESGSASSVRNDFDCAAESSSTLVKTLNGVCPGCTSGDGLRVGRAFLGGSVPLPRCVFCARIYGQLPPEYQ